MKRKVGLLRYWEYHLRGPTRRIISMLPEKIKNDIAVINPHLKIPLHPSLASVS